MDNSPRIVKMSNRLRVLESLSRIGTHASEGNLEIMGSLRGQCAFFDITIVHLNAVSNKSQATEKILMRHENEKKTFNRRVIEIEQAVFTPSVFGTNGAMAKQCAIFIKFLPRISCKIR